jgi:hypothetical protein
MRVNNNITPIQTNNPTQILSEETGKPNAKPNYLISDAEAWTLFHATAIAGGAFLLNCDPRGLAISQLAMSTIFVASLKYETSVLPKKINWLPNCIGCAIAPSVGCFAAKLLGYPITMQENAISFSIGFTTILAAFFATRTQKEASQLKKNNS